MRTTTAITRAARPRGYASRVTLRILGLLLLIIIIGSVGISTLVGWKLTHPEPEPLTDSPDNYGLSYDSVEFGSRLKDVTLKGWFLPAATTTEPAKMTVIMAHGYRDNRLQTGAQALKLAKELVAQGYNVLM